MCDCWVQRTMTVSPRPFEEILEAKEAEKCFSFCLVMCYSMLVLFVLCLHHVPLATAQMSILVYFFYRSSSICQSLSVSFYIPAPNFFIFHCLFLSALPDSGLYALLLHVDTPAPPCSSHNWLLGFILVYYTHTHKHTLTYTYTQERERKKRQSKKARQGERKGSGSCRRLGLVSVYCWSWLW